MNPPISQVPEYSETRTTDSPTHLQRQQIASRIGAIAIQNMQDSALESDLHAEIVSRLSSAIRDELKLMWDGV